MSGLDQYRKAILRAPKERTGFVAPKREPIKWGELAQGSAAGLLGAPVDLVNLLTQIKKPVMGSQWIGDLLGADTSALEFDVGQFIEPGGMAKAGISGLAALGGIIKNKGGNWIDGSIEKALGGLNKNEYRFDELRNVEAPPDPNASSLNKWTNTTLNKYIKNRMGTVDDEVRKLADQGITHSQLRPNSYDSATLARYRNEYGLPSESLAVSPEGRLWEENVDTLIDSNRQPVSDYLDFTTDPPSPLSNIARNNPWFSKLDPNTPIYDLGVEATHDLGFDLGFDHMIDELGNMMRPDSGLPMNLRLTPDSLGGLSMEEAIKKVHATNLFRAEKAKKANARFAQAEGIPVHKEYEDGWRWLEYKKPDELPEGIDVRNDGASGFHVYQNGKDVSVSSGHYTEQDALDEFKNRHGKEKLDSWLKQEGDTMGHCVGGYCDDVESGDSRILSLRSEDGKSMATVELRLNADRPHASDAFAEGLVPTELVDELVKDYGSGRVGWFSEVSKDPRYESWLEETYPKKYEISQVKGPGNKKPTKEAIPYIQDFVRTNDYPIKGDLQNTDLVDMEEFTGNHIKGFMSKEEARNAVMDLFNDPSSNFYGASPELWLKELAD